MLLKDDSATLAEEVVTLHSTFAIPSGLTGNEELLLKRQTQTKESKRKKKQYLKKLMHRVNPVPKSRKSKKGVMNGPQSIRTRYELLYESYCKLLGQPYIINSVFCFTCNNYYYYGDNLSMPKRCQVCNVDFCKADRDTHEKGHLARPDFIIDFNNDEARLQYKKDVQYHRLDNIKLYQDEYLKKVGIVRIDGGIHNKKRVMIRDYWQYMDFKTRGIKVFIVQNDDLDELLSKKDNGKSILELCKSIGDAILDEQKYLEYSKGPEYLSRIRKPF